jgi:hypothetical protein
MNGSSHEVRISHVTADGVGLKESENGSKKESKESGEG